MLVVCAEPLRSFHLTQNKRQNPLSGRQSLIASDTLLSVVFSSSGVSLLAPGILATMFQTSILPTQGFGTCSFLNVLPRYAYLAPLFFCDSLKSHFLLQFHLKFILLPGFPDLEKNGMQSVFLTSCEQ